MKSQEKREREGLRALAQEKARAEAFRAGKAKEVAAQRAKGIAEGLDHGADSGCGVEVLPPTPDPEEVFATNAKELRDAAKAAGLDLGA